MRASRLLALLSRSCATWRTNIMSYRRNSIQSVHLDQSTRIYIAASTSALMTEVETKIVHFCLRGIRRKEDRCDGGRAQEPHITRCRANCPIKDMKWFLSKGTENTQSVKANSGNVRHKPKAATKQQEMRKSFQHVAARNSASEATTPDAM